MYEPNNGAQGYSLPALHNSWSFGELDQPPHQDSLDREVMEGIKAYMQRMASEQAQQATRPPAQAEFKFSSDMLGLNDSSMYILEEPSQAEQHASPQTVDVRSPNSGPSRLQPEEVIEVSKAISELNARVQGMEHKCTDLQMQVGQRDAELTRLRSSAKKPRHFREQAV